MDSNKAQSIFTTAVENHAPDEWAKFLDDACGENAELRGRVELLLKAHQGEDSFLDRGDEDEPDATIDQPITEKAGMEIGPYKLLQQIGEGGFGVVYMAEQSEPVERRVALKIIKPGMDTRQVIARFEAERQALAMMDHPNISKVLDAGTTESGRPYFVMELVKGIPITKYCDQQHLTPKERLDLFIPICQAVQHAHQKGIIHRDLKPSNVLIALYDDRPVPKVIDFGVAKATSQKLTEKTMFTHYGQIVGTLEYMSPEQANLNQLDIDTRSDVYSLGVLMYELLTGATPFDRQRLRTAAFDEMMRIIREEEPPKPSTRLSTSESLPSVAASRHTEPKKLSTLVRGELDWIVMKALEKDRTRRYETANGLANDIQRYLDDEPVVACPPSASYRFRKFARRNKPTIVTTALIALTLIFGLVGTSWQAVLATHAKKKEAVQRTAAVAAGEEAEREKKAAVAARDEAESLRDRAEQSSDVAEARRLEADKERRRAEQNYRTARAAVDRLFTRVAERLQGKPHMEQIRRALLEDALEFYQGFLKEWSDNPELKMETALAHRRAGEIQGLLGDWEKSLANHQTSTEMLTELNRISPANVEYRAHLARGHDYLADALTRLARFKEAEEQIEAAIPMWEELVESHPQVPEYLEDFVRLCRRGQRVAFCQYKPAPEHGARSREMLRRLRKDFPNYPVEQYLIDVRYGNRGMVKDIESLLESEREIRAQIKSLEEQVEAHPDVPDYQRELCRRLANLKDVLLAMDRFEELELLAPKAIVLHEKLVENNPGILEYEIGLGWCRYNCGVFSYYMGREAEATEHFRAGIEIASEVLEKHPDTVRHYSHLVGMLVSCPAPQFREPERAIQLATRQLQFDGNAWAHLAFAQVHAGRYDEALASCKKVKKGNVAGDQLVAVIEAIAKWHLGRKEEAKRQFIQVTKEIDQAPGRNRWRHTIEYRLVRREVEELMDIERDETDPTTQGDRKNEQESKEENQRSPSSVVN